MKSIVHIVLITGVLAMVFGAPGCSSEGEETLYCIEPYLQAENDGETTVATGVVAHIFFDLEGKNWKPVSYEEALDGIVRDTIAGPDERAEATVKAIAQEGALVPLGYFGDAQQLFIVACDTENEVYAWRTLKTAENAGTVYMTLYFRPWQERAKVTATYTETGWTMVNKMKAEEGGGEENTGGGQ